MLGWSEEYSETKIFCDWCEQIISGEYVTIPASTEQYKEIDAMWGWYEGHKDCLEKYMRDEASPDEVFGESKLKFQT